jgi:hypothetical protein
MSLQFPQARLRAGFSVEVPSPTLVTGFVQSFLQGVIFMQAGQYWEAGSKDDSVSLRIYVALVVVLSM